MWPPSPLRCIVTGSPRRPAPARPSGRRIRRSSAKASLNLLWTLEGALTGLPWQQMAREHRTSLLLALETHEKGGSAFD